MTTAQKEGRNNTVYNFLKVGKYQFKWDCKMLQYGALSILATELSSNDKFIVQYSQQQLKMKKFFRNEPKEIKRFIETILFKNEPEMSFQIGFIDNRIHGADLKSNVCSIRKNQYTKYDQMVIILNYSNDWTDNQWYLNLYQQHKSVNINNDDVKYQSIVQELQLENKQLTQQLNTITNNITPKGIIVMWSGVINNIPNGWCLCDGNNNTPDLRNRFIIGAGSQYNIGATGGNQQHTHNIRVCPTKLQQKHLPRHQHEWSFQYWDIHNGGSGGMYRLLCANYQGDKKLRSNYVGGNESHDHSTYCTSSNNIPPYFSLAYIMKI